MGYLLPTDYVNFGLAADTTDDWVTVASSLMELYCRRESFNVTQYTERLRLTAGAQTVLLSYRPLVSVSPATTPLVSVQGRYTRGRRGELPLCPLPLEEALWAFGLPGSWTTIDPATVDWDVEGNLTFPYSLIGLPFNEVAVTYTAGLSTIPDAVKSACALIIKNAQAMPGTNVSSSRVDMIQMQYFSDQIVDSTVKTLLRPWVANRLG